MLTDEQFWESTIGAAIANKAEYNYLDFKLSLSNNNDRLKEHINAFGNSEIGGCFVFGVDDFVPLGVKESWDSIIQKVSHIANDTQEPKLSVSAFSVTISGKQLLCLHVLSGSSKPVFIKNRAPLGGIACFKRTGSLTIAMSIQEIKDLLAHSTEKYYDESIVEDAKIEDLDFEKLCSLLPMDINKPWSEKNIAILKDNQIIVGPPKAPKITVAGWLCFAKDVQARRQFRNAGIEFQIFNGATRENPTRKQEIKGTLAEQIEQSIAILLQHIWLVPKIQGAKREEVPAYQKQVLREVITNSLVHRDYTKMHQPVKIAFFSNRIEIENPGGLMPGLTILNFVHKRDWRNPLLAELLKKFGFGEMDGQGIDRLYAATIKVKVPPPIFVSNHNSFSVTLSAPKAFEEFTSEEKHLMVIILLIMQETVDNESVRNCFGISSEKSGTLLKAMVAEHTIMPSSRSRKYAKYVLTENYREKIFG